MEKVVKVTRNYQVTIPAEMRTAFDIKEGDLIKFVAEKDRIVLLPVKKKRLTYRAGFRISVEEMERTIEEMADEATR